MGYVKCSACGYAWNPPGTFCQRCSKALVPKAPPWKPSWEDVAGKGKGKGRGKGKNDGKYGTGWKRQDRKGRVRDECQTQRDMLTAMEKAFPDEDFSKLKQKVAKPDDELSKPSAEDAAEAKRTLALLAKNPLFKGSDKLLELEATVKAHAEAEDSESGKKGMDFKTIERNIAHKTKTLAAATQSVTEIEQELARVTARLDKSKADMSERQKEMDVLQAKRADLVEKQQREVVVGALANDAGLQTQLGGGGNSMLSLPAGFAEQPDVAKELQELHTKAKELFGRACEFSKTAASSAAGAAPNVPPGVGAGAGANAAMDEDLPELSDSELDKELEGLGEAEPAAKRAKLREFLAKQGTRRPRG